MLDGRLLVAIGDVAGHSLHAATVMAELRHAVRAYAVEGHPPGAVLELVNRFMRTVLPAESATLCLLTLDPATGRGPAGQRRAPAAAAARGRRGAASWSTRGAAARHQRAPAGRPGVRAAARRHAGALHRRPDRAPGRATSTWAWPRWRVCAAQVEPSLDAFCQRLLMRLAGAGQQADDIAVVALRRTLSSALLPSVAVSPLTAAIHSVNSGAHVHLRTCCWGCSPAARGTATTSSGPTTSGCRRPSRSPSGRSTPPSAGSSATASSSRPARTGTADRTAPRTRSPTPARAQLDEWLAAVEPPAPYVTSALFAQGRRQPARRRRRPRPATTWSPSAPRTRRGCAS